jgi:8-oxo-dGTP pyrophosphatase MutT (NUDIX family)
VIQPWEKKGETTDYDCGFFKIQVHRSASPLTGKEHPFYVLSTRDWINVIALTPEKKVLLVSQYRHGSEEVGLETPGGAVDRGESPLAAAQRELLEETGHRSDQWTLLGQVQPNPAILDNLCHFYLALEARQVGGLDLDEAEELEVGWAGLEEVRRLISGGTIRHALVVAAFHYLDLYREQNPGKI